MRLPLTLNSMRRVACGITIRTPSVIRSRVRMDYDGAEALLVRAGAVEYGVLEGAAEDVAAAGGLARGGA